MRFSVVATLVLASVLAACGANSRGSGDMKDPREEKKPLTADSPELAAITQVLEAHSGKLMATEGVVGIAIGLLPDGKTPCLKILVARMTPELEKALPATLDGHPVVVEVTGEIRPLDGE